jgi:hypothetical protein
MSTRSQYSLGVIALLASLVVTVRAADDVSNPTKRIEALAQAKALLNAKDAVVAAKDPFHSEAYGEALAAGRGGPATDAGPARPTQGPRSNRDLLQSIAASLKPSGFFVLSGEPTLVFGQKRVKAGGTLSIRFEDTDYTLEIVSIERPNFTLRLNREEFTRPIK